MTRGRVAAAAIQPVRETSNMKQSRRSKIGLGPNRMALHE
jgi:hypothetical protein